MRKRIVTRRVKTDDGHEYPLVPREIDGEGPCPGEAHRNPYIDNCLLCAPRWGVVTTYKPVDLVEAVKDGYAVPASDADEAAAIEAEAMGLVKLAHVEEKRRSSTASFYVYVSAELEVARRKA